ncbi:MAG TPA: hypothetical protein VEU31_07145 [Candidatus Acidoferrales bacterium]|nr:hypothetical protein [Candidatus Acidoferrales bacterium]
MEYMQHFAQIQVLFFLATLGALGLAGLVALYGLVQKKSLMVTWSVIAAAGIAAAYTGLLFADSLVSPEYVLARGEHKYFCEVDCHIAYSVEGVSAAKTLGPELRQRSAAGRFVVVRVKTWFDERTISPHRGDAPLAPGPRRVVLAEEGGRELAPSPEGQAALEQMRGRTIPLTTPLRPGESYETDLVFDVPEGARNLKLLIADPGGLDNVLIGHENSPLHKKAWFQLGAGI